MAGLDYHMLNWDGCPGDGDEGCADENCYYCHSPLRPPNLRCCAQNIAIAAALCWSFSLGYSACARPDSLIVWRPGQKTEAPKKRLTGL